MTTLAMDLIRSYLRRVALDKDGVGRTDGQLLRGFIDQRDDAAFAVLVSRHGPMVLGVCRRVLGNLQDTEDAFQVTFLILVKKAASIADCGSLGAWLYKVAFRTAQEARARIARQRAKEKMVSDMPQPTVAPETGEQPLRPVLDQELSRLPEKYRVPVILCELEGRSRTEVARLLRLPEGTLSSRLATARKLLARRLTRRGLGLSAGNLSVLFSAEQAAAASLPPGLTGATVQAAVAVAAGPTAAAGVLSPPVAALLQGVLRTMLVTQLKKAALVVLVAVALLGGGGWLLAGGRLTEKVQEKQVPAAAQDDSRARALALLDRAIQAATHCDKLQRVSFQVHNGTGLAGTFALQGLDQARIRGGGPNQMLEGRINGTRCLLVNSAQGWDPAFNHQLFLFRMRLYAFRAVQTLVPLADPNAFQLSPLGEVQIDQRPAQGIAVKCKEQQARPDLEIFFDKETGLAVKCSLRPKAPDRDRGHELCFNVDHNEFRFDNYQDLNGIKTFTRVRFKTDREEAFLRLGTFDELAIELREIKAQDKFDESVFSVPIEAGN